MSFLALAETNTGVIILRYFSRNNLQRRLSRRKGPSAEFICHDGDRSAATRQPSVCMCCLYHVQLWTCSNTRYFYYVSAWACDNKGELIWRCVVLSGRREGESVWQGGPSTTILRADFGRGSTYDQALHFHQTHTHTRAHTLTRTQIAEAVATSEEPVMNEILYSTSYSCL